jgi:hypothetical protein
MRSNALRKEIDEEEVIERGRSHLRVVESGELQAEVSPSVFVEMAPYLYVAIIVCAALAVWSILGFMNVAPPPPVPEGIFM